MPDECTVCEYETCPEVYCACYGNDDCANLAMCLSMCDVGYNPCVQNCYTLFAGGISIAAQASHCAATLCPGVCTGFGALPECNLCLFDRCAGDMNTCLANPSCAPLLWCTNACETIECIDGCYASHPNAVDLTEPVNICMQANCADDCAWALVND